MTPLSFALEIILKRAIFSVQCRDSTAVASVRQGGQISPTPNFESSYNLACTLGCTCMLQARAIAGLKL